MEDIKYHPLINDGSKDMIPMFVSKEKSDMAGHRFYLEEIIPHYYRFCSKNPLSKEKAADYQIHCPYCGKIMHPVASAMDSHKHSLYVCEACSRKA